MIKKYNIEKYNYKIVYIMSIIIYNSIKSENSCGIKIINNSNDLTNIEPSIQGGSKIANFIYNSII